MKKQNFFKIGFIALLGAFMMSCGSDSSNENEEVNNQDSSKVEEKDPPKVAPVGKYDNAIFSIPSPIQLSKIIQKSGAAYDANMLNPAGKVDNYTTITSQALNLGIYGADLGYATLYDNQQSALKYMKSAKKLSDNLSISEAFDNETLELIERNLDNKDSLLYVVSNTYRKADEFLQVSDRKYIGALIIVGGWIESLYFSTQMGVKQKSEDVYHLVGMQKHTLNTLLDKMLIQYVEEPGVDELFTQLEGLFEPYDKVNIKYTFAASEHDKEAKKTKVNATSSVEIDEATFKAIAEKIKEIRNQIIL